MVQFASPIYYSRKQFFKCSFYHHSRGITYQLEHQILYLSTNRMRYWKSFTFFFNFNFTYFLVSHHIRLRGKGSIPQTMGHQPVLELTLQPNCQVRILRHDCLEAYLVRLTLKYLSVFGNSGSSNAKLRAAASRTTVAESSTSCCTMDKIRESRISGRTNSASSPHDCATSNRRSSYM